MKTLVIALFSWAVPLAWVSAIPFTGISWQAEKTTMEQLASSQKLIELFIKEHGEAPNSLAEIRAFARIRGDLFSAYDAFSHRFEYLRLERTFYIFRSFGRDGRQNTLTTQRDPSIISLGKQVQPGLLYKYSLNPRLDFFPAALLLGAQSPNRVWTARLYIDRVAGARRLVIRHRGSDSFFMIAPHDGVEEFLWLPSGYQLVFTATASSRYRDGVYLWNLMDDTLVNLLDVATDNVNISRALGSENLILSLAGVCVEGPTVFGFLSQKAEAALDPSTFFAHDRLFAFRLPSGKTPISLDQPTITKLVENLPATEPLALDSAIEKPSIGIPIQQQWLKLPLEGDIETVLNAWQEFSGKEATSPLFPYGLWFLSSLYGDAYQIVQPLSTAEADILRSYGAELARALVLLPLAPRYLRGMGSHIHQSLMANQPLSYRISRLTTSLQAEPLVPAEPEKRTEK